MAVASIGAGLAVFVAGHQEWQYLLDGLDREAAIVVFECDGGKDLGIFAGHLQQLLQVSDKFLVARGGVVALIGIE